MFILKNPTMTAIPQGAPSAATSLISLRRVCAVVAVMGLFVLSLFAPAVSQNLRLSDGHVDAFTVTAEDGDLKLALKEDITGSGVLRAPESVVLVVADSAYSDATSAVPAVGGASYYLPQAQQSGLLWPGWDTLAAQSIAQNIDLNFESVSGPGEVFLFENSGGGGVQSVTSDGSFSLSSGSVINQPFPAHRHVHWAFTQPGTYTMQVTATSGSLTSNTATYTWEVGSASSGGSQGNASAGTGNSLNTAQQPAAPGNRNNAPASAPRGQASGGTATQPGRAGGSAPAGSGGTANGGGAAAGGTAGGAATGGGASGGNCSPAVTPMLKDDRTVPATWRNLSEIQFELGSAAKKDLPVAIGPVPKGPVWMIGSTQEPNVPWVGANSQHPSMLEHTQGPVTWELVGFSGPGPMVVYSQGGLGQVVGQEWFRGANNQAQGSYTIGANAHVHPNWVFGAPGVYQVSIRQTATLNSGEQVAGTGTVVFKVGSGSQSGHFDLGAAIDPTGGNCDPGFAAAQAIAPADQAAGGAAGAGGDTGGEVADVAGGMSAAAKKAAAGADTDEPAITLAAHIVQTLPYVILGLGLFVLGAGTSNLSAAVQRRKAANAGAADTTAKDAS